MKFPFIFQSGLLNIPGKACGTFNEVKEHLDDTYCGVLSAEFMHLKVMYAKNSFVCKYIHL